MVGLVTLNTSLFVSRRAFLKLIRTRQQKKRLNKLFTNTTQYVVGTDTQAYDYIDEHCM